MSEEVLALREQVDKLKKKLDKERQQFERELEAQKSVIETLKSVNNLLVTELNRNQTIAHNREAYQDVSRQLEDEKNKSVHYHKLSQERKRKIKELELSLQREKQNSYPSLFSSASAPSTPVYSSSSSNSPNPMNGQNHGGSNHFRSQSLDVSKEKIMTKSITFTSGENISPPNSVFVPNNGNALGLNANKPVKKKLGDHSGDEKTLVKPKGKQETPSRGSKNSEIDEVVSDPETKGLLNSKSNGGAVDKRAVRKSVSFEKVPFTDNNNPNAKEENPFMGHAQPLARSPSVKAEPKNISFTITSPDLTLHSSFPNDLTVRQVIAKLRLKFPGDTSQFHLYVKEKKGFYKELAEDKTLAAYKELEDQKTVILFQSTLPVEGRSRFGTLFGFGGGNEDKDRRKGTVVALDFSAKKEALADAINRSDFETVHTIANSLPVGMLTEGTNELGQNMLHLAVKCNSTGIFQIILNAFKVNNLNVNLPDVHGWTALHYAVSNDTGNSSDEEILTGLLEVKTLNVEHENLDKNTPLHYFCQKFIGTSASQLGEIIISKAPGLVNRRNKNGETPLHKAIYNPQIRVMLVKLLLNHGADTNIQTELGGETALHYAVRLGRKDILKFLLQSGAQMKVKDKVNGKTPYELAIETNEKDAISALKAAQDLKDWLEGLQLGDHFQSFIKHDLTLEIISQCDVAFLDSMMTEIGITAPETRSKVKDACKILGDTLSKKAFEIRLKTVSGGKFGGANEQIKVNTDNIKKAISELKYTKRAADDQSWLISHKEIEFTKELGSGTSATVFKGLYKGTKVAIKVLKAQQNAQKTDATIEEFKKEFHAMSAVLSPNIVQFFGACLEPRICIVMVLHQSYFNNSKEYCKNKSLYHVLKNEKLIIDWPRFFKFSIEMVAAIDSLHKLDPPIFHRDLKSLNLLLNKDWVIKLSDFGLARFQTAESQDTLKKLCGTYSYASPELFFGRPYTDKCDIFSVAVVLWEMAFRVMKGKYEAPYSEFPQLKVDYQIFFHVAKRGFRPSIIQGTPPILVELITRSWDEDPNKRPSSTEMLSDLILMETEYQQNTPEWDALVFNRQK